jgi:hypothetical protein
MSQHFIIRTKIKITLKKILEIVGGKFLALTMRGSAAIADCRREFRGLDQDGIGYFFSYVKSSSNSMLKVFHIHPHLNWRKEMRGKIMQNKYLNLPPNSLTSLQV